MPDGSRTASISTGAEPLPHFTCTSTDEPEAAFLTERPAAAPYLFGAGVERGEDALTGGLFWDVAVGIDRDAFAAAGRCTLTARATAAPEDLGHVTPDHTAYPYVEWNVPLSDAAGLTCDQHSLLADGLVAARYTDPATPMSFAHALSR